MSRKLFLPLAVLAFLSSAIAVYSLSDSTPTSCYPPLSLVTTSIPSATAGSSYSIPLAANGGQPPYTWSFGQSSLPSGFSISSSGDVTGTPQTSGTYTFHVVVSDSLKSSVTGELALIVAAAPTGTGTTGTTGTGTTGTTGTGTTGTTGTGTTGTTGTGTTGTTGTGTTGTTGTGTTGTTGTGTTGTTGTGTTGTTGTGTTGTTGTGTTGTTGTGTTGTTGTGTTGTTGTGTTGTTGTGTTGTTGTGTTGTTGTGTTGTTGTGTTGTTGTGTTGTTGTGTTGTTGTGTTGTTGTGTTGTTGTGTTGTTGTGTTGTTGTGTTGTTGTGTTGTTGTGTTGTTGTGTTTPTGTALTACQDLTSSGSYYLANDVSSAGTCFGIDANNITLNLNGHTITYGTGGGSTPTPAIEAHDSWWTGSPNYTGTSYSGSAHGGFEAYGGNIVQSANAAPFSSVFVFGEGTFSSPPYIHDITSTFQNQGAEFYYSLYVPPGVRIENNTIVDNVTNIQRPGQGYLSARSQFQGQTIGVFGNENQPATSSTGDVISGNKIIGGPQGGIRTVDQYSTITNNDVAQNALYSNDWCADLSADHSTAKGNNCHPKSGRGINIDASYVTVTNNIINVTELPQNMEYGSNGQPGCEGGGAYGMRIQHMPLPNQIGATTNDTISGNTITVSANACNAMGFDLIYMPANASGINITGNTVTTTNAGQSGVQDAGFQFDDSFGNGFTITGNTVTSSSEWMYGAWDGYSGFTVGHNTWLGSPTLTFLAQDGGCDPTVTDSMVSCPASINITDALPNKVACGPYSEAAVTINGQLTQCKASQ